MPRTLRTFPKLALLAVLGCAVGQVLPAQAQEMSFPEGTSPRVMYKALRKGANQSGLASVCSSTAPLRNMLIKSELSHHISNPGDGRQGGYTLVCGKQCPTRFPVNFYYCDGTLAGKFGYYGRWNGNGKPRAYGGAGGAPPHSVSKIAANARRKKCGSLLYLPVSGKSCVSWSASASRTGSPF